MTEQFADNYTGDDSRAWCAGGQQIEIAVDLVCFTGQDVHRARDARYGRPRRPAASAGHNAVMVATSRRPAGVQHSHAHPGFGHHDAAQCGSTARISGPGSRPRARARHHAIDGTRDLVRGEIYLLHARVTDHSVFEITSLPPSEGTFALRRHCEPSSHWRS